MPKPTSKHSSKEPSTPANLDNELQAKLAQFRELLTLKDEIKEGLLRSIEESLRTLAELGFHYQLVSEKTASKPSKKHSEKVLHCEICNTDGHDKRAHRSQETKAPFTSEELQSRGLAATA